MAVLSLEDYSLMREVIAAIREGLPEADQLQPGQVFQHVLGALRDIPPRMAGSSVSRTSLGQMRAAIATKASGLFFATLRTASKPSSAQTSAKSRIKR
jgi:hypothetical protein